MGPKSILKSSAVPADAVDARKPPVNEQHLQVALQHANIIQDQKNVEQEILNATLELLEFPPDSKADPARPSPSDAHKFKTLVMPFQPNDYDALIEERNCADLCGYALCPRPRKKVPSASKLHFVDSRDRGVQIVPKKMLEVWCSDDCARRALYVKVQLNEEPAWMRRTGGGQEIEILVENTEALEFALPLRLKSKNKVQGELKDEDGEDIAAAWALADEALAELSQERGDKDSMPRTELIKAKIEERTNVKTPSAPSAETTASSAHMAIEGHIPKSDAKKTKDADDDEEDNDWDD
ncbi:uncharacterized protein BDZ99DRAFT_466206 [Mytilinidion resinicola]|uniref:RNA polymerase II subunit B1 CTD phosphatase RPAP2 homolog n=1 Tax=Mytilinidion resinicola TaxID=574789 RepID=A0A6A6YAL1_9PEZI|nr:uncharacterized protein BDZ99DRAFT_466206 [Mytilinidion resinicola]KAF2805866.1 hypothetical protein BDZ99DRAFT_466206 [Mytilinidion resinicola]